MTELYHNRPYKPNRYKQFPPAKPGHKYCVGCEQEKPFEAFHKMKANVDGYRPACKACRKQDDLLRAQHSSLTPLPVESKICTKCKHERELEEFDIDPNGKAGRTSQCKKCRSEHNHQFWIDNQEDCRKRGRVKRAKSTYKARVMERHRKRMLSDPQYLVQRKIQRQKNYQRHRIATREYVLRRRARKLSATSGKVSFTRILERDGYHCYICDKPIDPNAKERSAQCLTFDHVIPLQPRPGEPQGTHSEENIRPAHHGCNVRKGNRPLNLLTPFDRRGV